MQYLLIKFLVTLSVIVLKGNLLIREEHEMIDENLSCLLQGILRMDGTVRRNLKHKLVIVGLLLNTIWLYSVLYVTDRSVNRIDCYYIHIGTELAILISGHISTTFVDCKINLHRCLGI